MIDLIGMCSGVPVQQRAAALRRTVDLNGQEALSVLITRLIHGPLMLPVFSQLSIESKSDREPMQKRHDPWASMAVVPGFPCQPPWPHPLDHEPKDGSQCLSLQALLRVDRSPLPLLQQAAPLTGCLQSPPNHLLQNVRPNAYLPCSHRLLP
jgi:hypothetical protein